MKMKMKIFIPSIIMLLILGACQDLGQEIITTRTYEQVIKSYNDTKARCVVIYTTVQNGFNPIGEAMMASVTDEAEHTLETASVQKFNNGSVNPNDNPNDVWSLYFQGIRRANQFLLSSDSVNLDVYKFDPAPSAQATYFARKAEINRWKYEARFLRAYFYFELIKRYGGVPIITIPGNIEDEVLNYKRNTLADCIDFIVDECDSAALKLPVKYTDATDHGRATKGAALALKSRMLLYAASDLFNDPSWAGDYANPELISATGDRLAKWHAAADAAKQLIDLASTAGYSLSSSYSSLFSATTFTNPEVIFCRRNNNSNSYETTNLPIGYQQGKGRTTPSQNLVDAYEVKVNSTTAIPFDWNNPSHAANPYATSGETMRDPRLGFSILRNGVTVKGRAVETFVGGLDGRPNEQATKTGYYINKYVNVGLDLLLNQTSNHAWAIFRLGEIYLNYAEALNESAPGHPDIKVFVDNVRKRATVNMPELPTGLTQDEMRDKIRHERRIELAFEDHRYWDLKRWIQAIDVLGSPLRGVKITRNPDLTLNYKLINVEDRVFEPKMYFYPIPQNEILVTGWVQNPKW